jgi:hypothetical protein
MSALDRPTSTIIPSYNDYTQSSINDDCDDLSLSSSLSLMLLIQTYV